MAWPRSVLPAKFCGIGWGEPGSPVWAAPPKHWQFISSLSRETGAALHGHRCDAQAGLRQRLADPLSLRLPDRL